ncbi:single-stranded DNA-binding protein, partial [Helicobacter pylori]
MFNKVIMVGRLTRNVELKYLPSGSAAATIGLATSRRFKKQDGTLG